jgi:DNA sulfur modification protein DndC
MSKKIDNIIEELIKQYLEDDRYNRPWIIGFSGGKYSTVGKIDKEEGIRISTFRN